MPGLYVMDSIIRQSRHQYGPDKDVFAPRFSKNIVVLFSALFTCSADDLVSGFTFTNNLVEPAVLFAIDVLMFQVAKKERSRYEGSVLVQIAVI